MPSKNHRTVLRPCQGNSSKNIPRGHLYKIVVCDENDTELQNLGIMTLQDAKIQYPNAAVSESDTLCPECQEDFIAVFQAKTKNES